MEMVVNEIREMFPALSRKVYGKDLVYFDNAATSQRTQSVIDEWNRISAESNANIHRAVHRLADEATQAYETARDAVKDFLNASAREEIVFTSGTTAAINLVAFCFGEAFVGEGDEVIVTEAEHHSNIVPWQMMCKRKGAVLKVLPVDESGHLRVELLNELISDRTRIMAVTHISNVLGLINPVGEIIELCHSRNVPVFVDGAQGAVHCKVDVQDLNVDFFAFSGHKVCGPMGIGVLYGKKEILEIMNPFMRGGEMIEYVTRESATYAEVPHKFEAGTVNAGGAVGLARALEYIQQVGLSEIEKSDNHLASLIMEELAGNPFVHVIGHKVPEKHCGIVTFTIDGVHPHDIASILDSENVAIRAGHHCAQPLMQKLGVGSTARASCYFYNTEDEALIFVEKVKGIRKIMGYKD